MSNKKKDREWLDSLKEMYKIREYSKMYSELLSYLEKYPYDDYGKFLYCNVLIKLEKYDEALTKLEELENCQSKIKYQVYLLLANVYSMKNNVSKTLKMIDNFLEGPYRDNNQLIILSKTYLNINYKKKALNAINKLKDIENTGLNNIVEAADVYSLLGMTDKSEELLNDITFGNKSTNLVLNMARIKEQNENYQGALGLIKYEINNVSSNDPNYFKLKLKECQLLIKEHEIEETINNCYKLLLDNKSDKDLVYLTLGDAYLEKYSINGAKENYEVVENSTNNDNRVEAILRIAKLYESSGKNDEANSYYDILIESDTKYKKNALFSKIFIKIREQDYIEAYNLLNEAKELVDFNEDYMGFRITNVYLNSMLGIEQEQRTDYSYAEKQIMNYNLNNCINHIKDHRSANSPFNSNIDVECLVDYTKNKLTKENVCYEDFFDIYEIDYTDVAVHKDRYRVIVIPNTKNIITMYPLKNDDYKYHKVSRFIEEENKYNKEIVEKRKKLYSKFYKD